MNWLRLPLAALLAAFTLRAFADPLGTVITYQGHLQDSGAPVTNVYDMRFKLFDKATAGVQVGSDVLVESVPVEHGYFTVSLDFGTAAFAGEQRFLEIYIGPENAAQLTKLDLRQAVRAAPEALHARGVAWSSITGVPTSIADGDQGIASVTGTDGIKRLSADTNPDVVLELDEEIAQRRVTGSCPNAAIQSIDNDGSVTCASVPSQTIHQSGIADEPQGVASGRSPTVYTRQSGLPMILHSQHGNGQSAPRLTKCNDPACTGGNEDTFQLRLPAADTALDVRGDISQMPNGIPYLAYKSIGGTSATLDICFDTECSGSSQASLQVSGTIISTATAANSSNIVVAAGLLGGQLRILRCSLPNCVAPSSFVIPSQANESPGLQTEVEVTNQGVPIIATLDAANGNIWVIACNDPACDGVGENVSKVSIGGPPISVALGGLDMVLRDGVTPVIAAFAMNGAGIAVVSCNDPGCSGSDEELRILNGANAGGGLSVVVGNDGMPAVAFGDTASGAVVYAKCQSDNCAQSPPWVTVDDHNVTIDGIDMTLGQDGNPIIAYGDGTNGALRVVSCANRSCQ